MLENSITWTLANFGLAMLVLSFALILFNQLINKKSFVYETSYKVFAFFVAGLTLIDAFIMHAFFPVFTAATIGWPNSPFQFEVATAALALGVIAVLSVNKAYEFRLATVIAITFWLWGDALGHIYQMSANHNFTSGNAGSWFYMDILTPVLLIICLKHLKNVKQAKKR